MQNFSKNKYRIINNIFKKIFTIKELFKFSTLSLILFSSIAKAGGYFHIKNNCEEPVTFNIKSKKMSNMSINRTILPHQIKRIAYFSNSNINFSFNSESLKYHGKLMVSMQSNFIQSASNINIKNRTGQIDLDNPNLIWQPWFGTPSFTAIACPMKVDIEKSDLLKIKKIKRIVIFGDSFSDTGNLHRYTWGHAPASGPYYNGMFSNGPLWSAILKQRFYNQIPVSNYSVGGAQGSKAGSGSTLYSLADEYSMYNINRINFKENAKERLVFIMIGGNDYLNVKPNASLNSLNKIIDSTMSNIKMTVTKLINQGVKHFVIANIPDLTITPSVRKEQFNAKNVGYLTKTHNAQLLNMMRNFYTNEEELKKYVTFLDCYNISKGLFDNENFRKEDGIKSCGFQ